MGINNLKTQREKMDLTQVQVARKVQISESAYQNYEAGKRLPNVRTAIKIAQALNSTVEKLFKENIT